MYPKPFRLKCRPQLAGAERTMANRACETWQCAGRDRSKLPGLQVDGAAVRRIGEIWGFDEVYLFDAPVPGETKKLFHQVVVLCVRDFNVDDDGAASYLHLQYVAYVGMRYQLTAFSCVPAAELVRSQRFMTLQPPHLGHFAGLVGDGPGRRIYSDGGVCRGVVASLWQAGFGGPLYSGA